MSTTTTNLGLIKPELTDPADITTFNTNWDKVDSQINNINSQITSTSEEINDINTSLNEVNDDIQTINDKIDGLENDVSKPSIPIVNVTSSDGNSYTATLNGLTEYYVGLKLTIIPNMNSAIIAPTLNINSLGAKNIIMPIDGMNTSASTNAATLTNWLGSNQPVDIMYDGTRWRAEVRVQSANYLYGQVPISKGGTGATTADDALSNLGASKVGHTHDDRYYTETEIDNMISGLPVSGHKHTATDITSGTLSSSRLPTVPLTKGGTGATSASAALTNLGAAPLVHEHSTSDITSGTLSTNRLPTISIAKGGTGATTADGARENLNVVSIDDLPNLYVWGVYNGSKSTMEGFKEEVVTDVTISNSTGMGSVATDKWETIYYSTNLSYESGTLDLLNGTSKTINSTSNLSTLLRKKYIKLAGGTIYYVPSDAVFSSSASTNTTTIKVNKLNTVNPIGKIKYVVTKSKTAYTDGSTYDGFTYYYHKQLGD